MRRAALVAAALALLAGIAGAYLCYHPRLPWKRRPPRAEDSYLLLLTDVSVNLADQDHPRYLTATVGLRVSGRNPQETAADHDAQIRDAVVMTMSRYAFRRLLTQQGKEELKGDLASAVTALLAEEQLRVEEVLFTSFIMN